MQGSLSLGVVNKEELAFRRSMKSTMKSNYIRIACFPAYSMRCWLLVSSCKRGYLVECGKFSGCLNSLDRETGINIFSLIMNEFYWDTLGTGKFVFFRWSAEVRKGQLKLIIPAVVV